METSNDSIGMMIKGGWVTCSWFPRGADVIAIDGDEVTIKTVPYTVQVNRVGERERVKSEIWKFRNTHQRVPGKSKEFLLYEVVERP